MVQRKIQKERRCCGALAPLFGLKDLSVDRVRLCSSYATLSLQHKRDQTPTQEQDREHITPAVPVPIKLVEWMAPTSHDLSAIQLQAMIVS